jgi:predicted nucleotidyltransferase
MKARAPGQSALLLLDVLEILARDKIPYVVIGAMAASVHGVVRASADVDALLSISTAKLGQLEKVLSRAGFRTELRTGDASDPIPALLAVSDRYENRVDLLAGLRGLDPGAFSRSIELPLHGKSIRIVGREDFIAMKCFAGGPQDITDARHALRVADEPVDVDLLRRLTRRFGRAAADLLAQILKA